MRMSEHMASTPFELLLLPDLYTQKLWQLKVSTGTDALLMIRNL